MAREPEEEETAGAAALARGCRGSSGPAGARARRAPLWLLCLGACWLLGAVADADFSILDEAQVLASQMRRLAAEELGVVTMQVSGPFCAPRTCQASCLFPMRRPRSHSPVQVPLTTHRPLWSVRSPLSARRLYSDLPSPPDCTPTLSSTQVPLPFSSAEAPALCTEPTLRTPPPSSFISARVQWFLRILFPNLNVSPPPPPGSVVFSPS